MTRDIAPPLRQPVDKSKLTFGLPLKRRKSGGLPAHLAFIRLLPCAACGDDRSDIDRQPHHLNDGRYMAAKTEPDYMTVPLCPFHHRQLHDDGEEVWAATYGGLRIQWLAGALWASSGDYAKACQAIGMARS